MDPEKTIRRGGKVARGHEIRVVVEMAAAISRHGLAVKPKAA